MAEALNQKKNTIIRLSTFLMQEGKYVVINLLYSLGKHSKWIDSGKESCSRCRQKGEPYPQRLCGGDIPESLEMFSIFKALGESIKLMKPKNEPEDSDLSLSADIARIRLYRNEIYTLAYKKISELTDDKYEDLYEKIMSALTRIVKDYSRTNYDAVTIWEEKVAKYRIAPITEEDIRNVEDLKCWYLRDLEEEKAQSSRTTDQFDAELKVNCIESDTEEFLAQTATHFIEEYNRNPLGNEKETTKKVEKDCVGHKLKDGIALQEKDKEHKFFAVLNWLPLQLLFSLDRTTSLLKGQVTLEMYYNTKANIAWDFYEYEEALKYYNSIKPSNELCFIVTKNNTGCFEFFLEKQANAEETFKRSLNQLTNCAIEMLVKENQSAVILKSILFVLKNNFAFVELEKGNFDEALILFKDLFEEECKSSIDDTDFRDHEQSRDTNPPSRDTKGEDLWNQFESPLVIIGPSSCYQYSRKNLQLASVALNYSRACLLTGNLENIVEDLEHVLRECQFSEGEYPLRTMICVRLVRILTLLGKIKRADEVMELRGIDIIQIQKIIEKDSLKPFSGMFTEDICRVLAYRGERTKSREILHTAIRVCQEVHCKNNPMRVSLDKTTDELFPTVMVDKALLAVNGTAKGTVFSLKIVIKLSIQCAMRGIKEVHDREGMLRQLDVMKGMASGTSSFADWYVSEKQVSASTPSPEFVLIRTWCICLAFFSQLVESTEIAEECLENQLETITSLCDFLNETMVSEIGSIFLSDYESCIMSSLCFLLETALLRQVQTSANNICKSLASYLSSRRKEDAKKSEWYKDYCGVLSSFVSSEQILVSGIITSLFVIVTCGLNRSESVGVHPEYEALFRKVKIDSEPEVCSTPYKETRLQWFVYLRSRDLLDINEFRQISKNIVGSVQSLESLSIHVGNQGVHRSSSKFIEVMQEIHPAEMSNVCLQLRLLRNCWGNCAEPVYPCPVKARSMHDLFLWKIQKQMMFKDSDIQIFLAVFQHTLCDMTVVDVLHESKKTLVCHFRTPPFCLLTLHSETSTLTFLTLQFLTDACSRDGAVTNDTTQLLDSVIEDCSEKLNIRRSSKLGNAWYRITDVESNQSPNLFLDGAEQDDDLDKARKANDRLTAEVKYLKSRTSELSVRMRNLRKQLLEMEARAFLLNEHFVQSVCSSKDTTKVVENWMERRGIAIGTDKATNHEPTHQDRVSNLGKYLVSMSNDELAELLVDIQSRQSDQLSEKAHYNEGPESFKPFLLEGDCEGERTEGAVGPENHQQPYVDIAGSKYSSQRAGWCFPPAESKRDSLTLKSVRPIAKETMEKGLADFQLDRAERRFRKLRLSNDILALKYHSRATGAGSFEDSIPFKTSSQKEDYFSIGTLSSKEREKNVRYSTSGIGSISDSKRVIPDRRDGSTIQDASRPDKTLSNIREFANEGHSIATPREPVAFSGVLPSQNSIVSETLVQDAKPVFSKETLRNSVSSGLPFMPKQDTELTETESSGNEKSMNESPDISGNRESKHVTADQRDENKVDDAATLDSETWSKIKQNSGNGKDSIGAPRQSMASSCEMTDLPSQDSAESETSVQERKAFPSIKTSEDTALPKQDTYIAELEWSETEQSVVEFKSDVNTTREFERSIMHDPTMVLPCGSSREPGFDDVIFNKVEYDNVTSSKPACDEVTRREPACDDVTSKKVVCGDVAVMCNALESTSNDTVKGGAVVSLSSAVSASSLHLIGNSIFSKSNEYDKQGSTGRCKDVQGRSGSSERNFGNMAFQPDITSNMHSAEKGRDFSKRVLERVSTGSKLDIDDFRRSLNVIRETDDSGESAMDWNSQGARPKRSKGQMSEFIVCGVDSSFLARHTNDFSLTGALPSETGADHRAFLSLPVRQENHGTRLTTHDLLCDSYGESMPRLVSYGNLGTGRRQLVNDHGNNLKMSMSSNESKENEDVKHTTNDSELVDGNLKNTENGQVSSRQSVGAFDQTTESHPNISSNEYHLPLLHDIESSLPFDEITTTSGSTPQSISMCSIESYATADSSIRSLENQVEETKMTLSQMSESIFFEEKRGEQKLDGQELNEQHPYLENKEETETRASLDQERCEQNIQRENKQERNGKNEVTTQSGIAVKPLECSVILEKWFETSERGTRDTNEERGDLLSHPNGSAQESRERTTNQADDQATLLLPQRVPAAAFDARIRELLRAREREREQNLKKQQEENERRLQELRERHQQNPPSSPQPARLPVQESAVEWPCNHYKRKCEVRFHCCDQFYSCHRCHNTSGQCTKENNKALDATHLRCLACNTEQEIKEDSHHCKNCNVQLSEYFCGICKHFTGMEKTPYHCKPCGICRIHRDKSFHCEVCNVCLDERLRGKHKCRPDSGHDECCICLEDAFGGCQVLPCSHKVHRDCAVAMIRNGVRKCPVCRFPLNTQQ